MQKSTPLPPTPPAKPARFRKFRNIMIGITTLLVLLVVVATTYFLTAARRSGPRHHSRKIIGLNITEYSLGNIRTGLEIGECYGNYNWKYQKKPCGLYSGCMILYETERCHSLAIILDGPRLNDTLNVTMPTAFNLQPLQFGKLVSIALDKWEPYLLSILVDNQMEDSIDLDIGNMFAEATEQVTVGNDTATDADTLTIGLQKMVQKYIRQAYPAAVDIDTNWNIWFNYKTYEDQSRYRPRATYYLNWRSTESPRPFVQYRYDFDGREYDFDVSVTRMFANMSG